MDLIQLKIKKPEDSKMAKYIKLIREFDHTLSIADIIRKMEQNQYIVEFDLEYDDFMDDIKDINRKEIFRSLISKLSELGAVLKIYQNNEEISLELLDHWLVTLEKINRCTAGDIEREAAANSKQNDWKNKV